VARRGGTLQDVGFTAGLLTVGLCLIVVAVSLTRKDGVTKR